MADYYVLGDGRTIHGPYRRETAVLAAANIADDNYSVQVLRTDSSVKGATDDSVKDRYAHLVEEDIETPRDAWERVHE
jgi:hypothetical protein